MVRKRTNSRFIEVKPEFESILVCKNTKLCPFIQILIQEPENIDSQNLGSLIGIFEVANESEDSSYIVNYLISVIKKEYFSKPKRGPIESLEASLHKANLALSSLAEHENIDWIGRLNAIVAVTEKNGLHLSQAGTASALLLRGKTLSDLGDGLCDPDGEPNPLKTFVNVSSGRMEKDDKLLLSTAGMFDIFSIEEIKKSSLRFSNVEFIQFLRTALGSELEKVAVLVADFSEKSKEKSVVPDENITLSENSASLNVFSNETFKKTSKKNTPTKIAKTNTANLQKEIQKIQPEFIDKKTGHIYIKEDSYADENHYQESTIPYVQKIIPFIQSGFLYFRKKTYYSGKIISDFIFSLPAAVKKYSQHSKLQSPPIYSEKKPSAFKTEITTQTIAETPSLTNSLSNTLFVSIHKTIPDFKYIKRMILNMDYQQRLYSLLALILVFIIPIYVAKFLNKKADPQNIPVIVPEIIDTEKTPLSTPINDSRIKNISATNPIMPIENISGLFKLNDIIYAINPKQITNLQKQTSTALPAELPLPMIATGMDDLNTVFILGKNKRLFSFIPATGEFKENTILIPTESNITAIGTYLTYLYLVDSKNNQIYRYPRIEGGFSEKTNWLKETISLENILGLYIQENIFIAQASSISKLFRGKKESFDLENIQPSIQITNSSIEKESGNILVLDKNNSRAIYFNAEGKIIFQYQNPELTDAIHIILDEKNNLFYFSTEKEIKSIVLN